VFDLVDRIVLIVVAGMAAVFLYVVLHDAMGIDTEAIGRNALLAAGVLGIACASSAMERVQK
jgi:hypothetical protein